MNDQSSTSRLITMAAALVFSGAAVVVLQHDALAASPTQVIKTKPGVVHNMPLRPAQEEAAPSAPALAPRLIPIGDAALRKIKARGAPAEAADDLSAVRQAGAATSGPEPHPVRTLCNAQATNGFAPSDSHGAVGTSRFVTVTNTRVSVQNKTGCTFVSNQLLTDFFAPVGVASGTTLFDPRALYDRINGRFFVTAESLHSSNTDQFQYFAVSTSSTATSWRLYRIRLSQGSFRFCKKAVNSFWDYPSAGHSRARWFITANDFGTTVTGAILDINKAPTLTGASTTVACFANVPFNLAPPIILDKQTLAFFLSPGSGFGSAVQRRRLNQGTAPANDTLTTLANVSILSWTAPPDAAQPNGQLLDTLDGRFQSASIQSRWRLWNTHAVAASTRAGTRSRIRVYKLSLSSTSTSPLMTLNLFTDTASGTGHHFNPSVATGSGAFNAPMFVTGTRTIPTITTGTTGNASSIMYSGLNSSTNIPGDWRFNTIAVSGTQFVTDGFGTNCNNTARGSCRWGDYSATQVDPSASGRAWGWDQFITNTTQFNWGVRVGEVELNLSTAPTASADLD